QQTGAEDCCVQRSARVWRFRSGRVRPDRNLKRFSEFTAIVRRLRPHGRSIIDWSGPFAYVPRFMKNSIAGLLLVAAASLLWESCASFPGVHKKSDVAAEVGTKTISIHELDESIKA